MAEKQLRIGVIGVGYIGKVHIANLQHIQGVAVTAVCDIELEIAKSVAEPLGATPYEDWEVMLRVESLDGLFVCIPQFSRSEEVQRAAELGIPVFVEKPAAPNVELGQKNVETIRSAQIINTIGYMWRSSSCLDKMKSLIGTREIGLIHGFTISHAPFASWFWDKDKSGGQIFDQTTHILNLAAVFGGDAGSVAAMGSTGRLLSEEWVKAEDVSGLLVKYRNGTIGTFANTWAHDARASSLFSLSVFGRRFSLSFEPMKNRLTGFVDDVEVAYQAPEDTRMQEVVNFIEAVRSGRQEHIRCSYEEGLETLEVTLAANRALSEGHEISL